MKLLIDEFAQALALIGQKGITCDYGHTANHHSGFGSVVESPPQLVLLYDGECGLCHGLVQFVLHRDRAEKIYFVALQSDLGERILKRHGIYLVNLDTVYWVEHFDQACERLSSRSDAILRVMVTLGSWYLLCYSLYIIPRILRDGVYNGVARSRYRLFGRIDRCEIPSVATRRRFLA